jgi:hypothetical protein
MTARVQDRKSAKQFLLDIPDKSGVSVQVGGIRIAAPRKCLNSATLSYFCITCGALGPTEAK